MGELVAKNPYTYLSTNRLAGVFEPTGNRGFSPDDSPRVARSSFPLDLEEFPAFPDLTIPLRGGINFVIFQ